MAQSIVLLRALIYAGTVSAAGDTVSVDDAFAREAVEAGHATYVTDPRPVAAEDFHISKDEAEALFHAKAAAVRVPVGAAVAALALAFGTTDAEGLQVKIIDETVVFAADNAALYKALTAAIPSGAVILSVQANLETAITGGGTTVKVGLGLNATDPDKYGIVAVLTKNGKANTVPDWAVLSGAEQIDVCACATNGAAGNTALTSGSVRVRIAYLQAASLKNA